MKTRRGVLGLFGVTTFVGGAGCLGRVGDMLNDGTEAWGLEVSGDEPELAPGDESTVHVEANPIQTLQIEPEGNTGLRDDETEEAVELDILGTTLEPHPSGSLDMIPPVWHWGSQTHVSGEIPVYVANNAEAGEYPYSVTVTEGDNQPQGGETETIEFTITVTTH